MKEDSYLRSSGETERKPRIIVEIGAGVRSLPQKIKHDDKLRSEIGIEFLAGDRYIGVDSDESNLKEVQQRDEMYPVLPNDIEREYRVADASVRLPFEDGTVDVIYATNVFSAPETDSESKVEKMIEEMLRVLKDGGRLIIDEHTMPVHKDVWSNALQRLRGNLLLRLERESDSKDILEFVVVRRQRQD